MSCRGNERLSPVECQHSGNAQTTKYVSALTCRHPLVYLELFYLRVEENVLIRFSCQSSSLILKPRRSKRECGHERFECMACRREGKLSSSTSTEGKLAGGVGPFDRIWQVWVRELNASMLSGERVHWVYGGDLKRRFFFFSQQGRKL